MEHTRETDVYVQGACNDPVPDDFPPLTVSLLPGQCVVVLPPPEDMYLSWESTRASLWMHNIYFLVRSSSVYYSFSCILTRDAASVLLLHEGTYIFHCLSSASG